MGYCNTIRKSCVPHDRFWCAFGPKSSSSPPHTRKCVIDGDGNEASSQGASNSKKKRRPPLNKGMLLRGCQCHFQVKRLANEPDVGVILYIHPYHTNVDDEVCHSSSHDGDSSKFSPWISMHKKVWIANMLFCGFSPQQVMEKHIQAMQALHTQTTMDPTYSMVRDDFLSIKDVLNIGQKLSIDEYQWHDNDAESVRRWCMENKGNIFVYQHQDEKNSLDFVLGIQTPWQREMCFKHGNANLLAMDATFGTNKYKFNLYTILVFDSHRNGVPIAWVLTASATFESTRTWLTCFRNSMLDHHKSWEPGACMVDDAEQEIAALRVVFHQPILLCLWHVKRCWLKHLIRKVKDWPKRAEMFRALGAIMNMQGTCTSTEEVTKEEAKIMLESFYNQYSQENEFIMYLKTYWESKIEMWVWATRNFPHVGQDTNGSIEAYHGQLKSKFLGSTKRLVAQRVDWLLHKLTTSCLPHYWFLQQLKDNGFRRNNSIDMVVENSYQRALQIPDGHVTFVDTSKGVALVESISSPGQGYTVFNTDCEWACCTCKWAEQGNICKHQIKVMLMRGDTQASLVKQCMDMYKSWQLGRQPRGRMEAFSSAESPPTSVCAPMEEGEHEHFDSSTTQVNIQPLRQIFEELLVTVGGDKALIKEASDGLRRTLAHVNLVKAQPDMEAFSTMEDGFSNTLKRAKPFIEKRSSRRQERRSVHPFSRPEKQRKVSMQAKLDKKAKSATPNIL
ncbi:hypothetical protein GOP47_0014881 [Adiantum capillus-veneris]|uniref:SWIM-type domain-containing protein n=1 Tax=Adiantum capillus-veneris TaxID=13818 RepID=A0A9D4ZCK7_ADICA|nr:hypothetical protein GOP47_0014881 [Adiantum capillus-veneris]